MAMIFISHCLMVTSVVQSNGSSDVELLMLMSAPADSRYRIVSMLFISAASCSAVESTSLLYDTH